MELTKIKGSTYFIDAPTNIGVYIFKNKNCLLIDTGLDNASARKVDEVLIKNGLHVKYIMHTHAHPDHVGGSSYFSSSYPGCQIYATDSQSIYMERPALLNTIVFSAIPVKKHRNEFKPFKRNFNLDMGVNKINDEKFEIISLFGHSTDHIGIITPDKVAFLGDSMYSKDILSKYSLPFLFNIEESVSSINKIKELDSDFFLLSHIDEVLNKDKVIVLADININNLVDYEEQILTFLDEPMSKEDILENLIGLNDLKAGFLQYHLYSSTVTAFLMHLYDKDLITNSVENGRLYYYKNK